VCRESRRALRRLGAAVCALAACAGPVPAVELSVGDVRADLAGSVVGSQVFKLDPDTPDERPSGALDLRLEATRGEHLHLFTSLRGGYDGKVGDPDRDNPFYNPEQIYQDRDLFLDFPEAYLDVYAGAFELRLGRQKISWGQLDDLQPTDHLNPEDMTEFYFRPELERKIGVPAARLAGYYGPWTLELVWAPWYSAYRFPDREDRWFPPLLEVPDRVATPLGRVPVDTQYPDVDAPAHTLASSDVGARVTRFLGGAEMSAAVFHGWDKSQTFSALGTATLRPTGVPTAPVASRVHLDVVPSIHRITMVGGDMAVPIWMLALRAEAAWIHGRFHPLLLRDQIGTDPQLLETLRAAATRVATTGNPERVRLPLPPSELRRETLQYGVGVDLNVNEPMSYALVRSRALAGTFVLFQLIETVIFDHDAAFIADEVEHLLAATLRRNFRDERLLTELKVVFNPNHGDYIIWPQVAYKLTPLTHLLFEARVIGGDPNQPIGEFRDYDGIRIGMRRFL
jgi:hypothetical protein